jgi:4'-phosphopantetheinyl transferase EntD
MLTYRLTKTLNPSEDSEWKQLVISLLGEGVHPKRAKGFCLSREALKQCLSERGIHISVPNLILETFAAVRGQDSLTISLSHTPEWGAALVGDAQDFVSVGIDLEPLERIVKAPILERISHSGDLKLTPLKIWTLKEASFKAIMNTGKFEHAVEFSSIQIADGSWIHSNSGLKGLWRLIEQDGMCVSPSLGFHANNYFMAERTLRSSNLIQT